MDGRTESVPKMPGKKRKTMMYWKKLLKEGGIGKTRIGKLTSNRKEWKLLVKERIKHLEKWEEKGGKRKESRIRIYCPSTGIRLDKSCVGLRRGYARSRMRD